MIMLSIHLMCSSDSLPLSSELWLFVLAVVRPGRVSDGVDHPADRHHGGQSHLEQHPGGPAPVRGPCEESLQWFTIASLCILLSIIITILLSILSFPFISLLRGKIMHRRKGTALHSPKVHRPNPEAFHVFRPLCSTQCYNCKEWSVQTYSSY